MGRPDNCHPKSMQPCPIPPKGASPREATDITLRRNQGSLIRIITNPSNHAASRPKWLRAFRYMGASDTRRTASTCSRQVPRGHGIRGGRPAPGKTASLVLARENAQRGDPKESMHYPMINKDKRSYAFTWMSVPD